MFKKTADLVEVGTPNSLQLFCMRKWSVQNETLTLQAFSQTSMLGIQGMCPIWFSSDPAEHKFISALLYFLNELPKPRFNSD